MTERKIERKPPHEPRVVKTHSADSSTIADAVEKSKHKLVRDSFTIPKSEYLVLEGLKLRAADLKRPTKKSELLRAGIAALAGLSDAAFLRALNSVVSLKTGRPKGTPAAVAAPIDKMRRHSLGTKTQSKT